MSSGVSVSYASDFPLFPEALVMFVVLEIDVEDSAGEQR